MEIDIELEEVESLHVEPLMDEAGHEVIGTRIRNQPVNLLPKHFWKMQFGSVLRAGAVPASGGPLQRK